MNGSNVVSDLPPNKTSQSGYKRVGSAEMTAAVLLEWTDKARTALHCEAVWKGATYPSDDKIITQLKCKFIFGGYVSINQTCDFYKRNERPK